ncbi:MAG: hypothetical protein ACLR7M_07645 [Varibaculum timonense]|uniref:hypothetical protein n=1 Tax=Varibaculum timonense TaxID=1964383 RepID=UPI0022E38221|nr:hypothetical protein [Varibaculum timonense]
MATRDFLPATDGCHLREQHKYRNIVRTRWLKMEQTEAAARIRAGRCTTHAAY